jgi:sirohydrochlorin cobaltochelatase
MDSTSPPRAVVLFGHGSRDPLWRGPIEAVAARVAAAEPQLLVRCAYLELEAPTLPACVAELSAAGVRRVTVVPMFLGTGRHAREDLPRILAAIRAEHPDVVMQLQPAVGEDARVLALLADIARE